MIIHTITSPAFVFLSMSYSTMKSPDIPRSEFCLWSASEGLYEILADFEVGLLTTANVLPAVNGIFSIKSILNKLSLHKYLLSSINEKKALFNMLILEKCLKSPPPHIPLIIDYFIADGRRSNQNRSLSLEVHSLQCDHNIAWLNESSPFSQSYLWFPTFAPTHYVLEEL